jgi:ASC-1-like (ASCH) protein
MRIGDILRIINYRDSSVTSRIVDIRKYSSSIEYPLIDCLSNSLPDVETLTEGIAVHRKYYSIEEETQ